MSEALQFGLSAAFLLIGAVIILLALFGVFRFRFVMNRMHCAAMIDSLGNQLRKSSAPIPQQNIVRFVCPVVQRSGVADCLAA